MAHEVKVVRLDSLTQDPANANKGSQRGDEMIESSLKKYGGARSIVLDGSDVILAGNKTAKNALRAGFQEVIVVETDGTQLVAVKRMDLDSKDPKAKELAIADNRTGEVSLTWDVEQVSTLLQDPNVDVNQFFTWDELRALDVPSELLPPLEDSGKASDDTPEMNQAAVTQKGDLYVMGDHRLLCGDSRVQADLERLMGGVQANMLVCDPPYGMRLDTDYSKLKGSAKQPNAEGHNWRKVEGDDEDFDPTAFIAYFDYCEEQFWWGADYFFNLLPPGGSLQIWLKRDEACADMIGNDFEVCWSRKKHKKRTFWRRWVGFTSIEPGTKRIHPTQKPIDLYSWIFDNWGAAGDVVVDLFGGSGSSLIASEKEGRRARLIEIDPLYCDLIVERWTALTGKQVRRFDANGEPVMPAVPLVTNEA